MAPPTVSLCIPVYEPQPRHLERLLASIAAQGHDGLDVVLTDDSATPGLDALVGRVGLADVTVVHNPQRLGMVANWNEAGRRATGELMMVLGQDDELGDGLIGRYLEAFAETPEAVACSSGEVWIDHDDREVAVPRRPNRRERIFVAQRRYTLDQDTLVRLCLRNGQVYGEPSAVMFRRAAFEAVGGYRQDMGHVADLDLVLRLAGQGPVRYLAEPLVRRRLHGAMATADQQASGETAAARERLHRAWVDHPGLSERDRQRARASLVSWAARDVVKALRHRRWEVARGQAAVVRRYARVAPTALFENATELVTGQNRDAR
ncbi:MAG: glycosyltransferase family 2 protein [Acidimicrobiales bacterium]|nr:glycosyltransferase family 2 protein [Acidimicrobiales bacterium]